MKVTWANEVRIMSENEEKSNTAEFRLKEVQYIQAKVGHLMDQNHLFKCSIILIKARCYCQSRILGAHHVLVSTHALKTLVLYIFNLLLGLLRWLEVQISYLCDLYDFKFVEIYTQRLYICRFFNHFQEFFSNCDRYSWTYSRNLIESSFTENSSHLTVLYSTLQQNLLERIPESYYSRSPSSMLAVQYMLLFECPRKSRPTFSF